MSDCAHKYSTNSGRGGKPEFRRVYNALLNQVRCVRCGERTWLNQQQMDLVEVTQRPVVPPKPPVKPVS